MIKLLSRIWKKGQNTPTSKSFQVYDSLEELKILTFWKIVQDKGNIYLLHKDFSTERKYTEKEEAVLLDTWGKLQDAYFLLEDNPKQKASLRKSSEQLVMQFKVRTLLNHYEFYSQFLQYENLLGTSTFLEKEKEILELFRELGFSHKLKAFNTPLENALVIKRYVEAVINKLNRISTEVKEDAGKEIKNIYDNVASIEQILERTIGNIENITVMQWVSYVKTADSIVKAKNKQKHGKK